MNRYMRNVKDKLYYYFAEKNWGVRREYPEIKEQHDKEGDKIGKWKKLIHLNWHYRVLRKTSMLYCQESVNNDTKNAKQRLPYLDGAESELSNRRNPIYFVKDLLQYDVVSFDIFDTLVLRPFSNPKDLFMIVGSRLNKTEFYRIRIEAERKAREKMFALHGHHEVTIYDIYSIIEERTGIDKNLGVEAELEVEMQYCFANPYMKRVFQLLKAQNKPIIIVSDMYLPHDMMEKLLTKVGYWGYEKIYVSCDYKCSKRTTGLYQYVKQEHENMKIVHIGDNMVSDIQSANKVGIDTRYYRNVHEVGQQYRADGMSELVGSAYAGIINTHLHNGIKQYSPYYEYGFIYGGLYIMGFCNWIHKKAKEKHIDKVLFLSRDGAIYQKVFNMLFSDVDNEYFLWSRIANTKYTLLKNRDDFLRRVIYYRAIGAMTVSVDSLLESLSLSSLKKYLSQYDLKLSTLVLRENVEIIEKLFIEHWDEVCNSFEIEKNILKEYIKEKLGDSQRAAFIDVGWLGSGPLGLKYLIEEEFNLNCEVYCWQAAAKPPQHTDILVELQAEIIEPYLFSRMFNRNHFDIHANTNHGLNNIFFEMFTQDITPSFGGIDETGAFLYDIPEVENYKIIREIHQGIFEFCMQYKKTFCDEKIMMNISGYDAYLPYRMIIRNLDFVKKYFSNVTFARGVSGDTKKQKLETVGEIMEKAGC